MDGGGLWLWRDDPEIRSGGKSISDVGGVNKWFLEAAVNTGRGGRIEKSRHQTRTICLKEVSGVSGVSGIVGMRLFMRAHWHVARTYVQCVVYVYTRVRNVGCRILIP